MSRYVKQVNPRQEKSVKCTPVAEGGLGLSRDPKEEVIKKPQKNVEAKYWYDKYEELVQEVSYHRKKDRQYLNELDEKLNDVNQDLLSEITTISDSDPLAPLEKKFVTVDQLTDHYRLFLSNFSNFSTSYR